MIYHTNYNYKYSLLRDTRLQELWNSHSVIIIITDYAVNKCVMAWLAIFQTLQATCEKDNIQFIPEIMRFLAGFTSDNKRTREKFTACA